MANNYFNFKQFTINQEKAAFKVGTDGVLLGASADISGVKSILDIGSGTGLISIMLAQRCDALITAIEPDFDSYVESLENAGKCHWSERITIINTSLQNFIPEEKFDLIVTNPPYFTDCLKNPDSRKSSVRHNDNLSQVEILEGVMRLMNDTGRFQLILPYVEGNIFIVEAAKFGLYCNRIIKVKPLPASEIRRLILSFSKINIKSSESYLTIERGKRFDFTEEYRNLTKDFYLKF